MTTENKDLWMTTTRRGVNYAVGLVRPVRFWCRIWTPGFHEGRGPYVTIGLGFFALYRGY